MEDLLFLINILGCSRIYLTCCETSGYLGWKMAERFPDIVSKLIVINCPHPSVLNDYFNSKLYNYVKFWYLIVIQYPLLPHFLLSSKYEPETLLSLMVGKKSVSEDEREAYMYTFFRKDDWKGSIYHLRQINLKPKLKYDEDEIRVLSTPTLLLSGSDHPFLPTELSFRSAELVERINIKIIPKCGMHPEASQPALINQEILRFFQPPVNLIEATTPNDSNASFVSRVLGTVASTYRR
ncbi:Epoxide hydrolase 4 [Armadillidium vulgare]|nr:Epoxide hydrolase 4 [Armadillidium vulgare]